MPSSENRQMDAGSRQSRLRHHVGEHITLISKESFHHIMHSPRLNRISVAERRGAETHTRGSSVKETFATKRSRHSRTNLSAFVVHNGTYAAERAK